MRPAAGDRGRPTRGMRRGGFRMTRSQQALFTFYDMFAGIGAFHLAARRHGGRCLGACDIDRFARETYLSNFHVVPEADVRDIERLPEGTDLLFAGFPCPTFSIAGKSKLLSLGRKHGLDEKERGQLIFEVARVVKESAPEPKVIVLENVKHLINHDGGRTIGTIVAMFRKLGYESKYDVLDALDFGCPQHRERVFIVMIRGGFPEGFSLPAGTDEPRPTLSSILDSDEDVPDKYTLGEGTWDTLERHKKRHSRQGNGFGYRLLDPSDSDQVIPTISARYHKDGAEALIDAPSRERPRRLTPTEVARAFGFPGDFKFPVSDTQQYRQLGNSIVVPVAEAVVRSVVRAVWATGDDQEASSHEDDTGDEHAREEAAVV